MRNYKEDSPLNTISKIRNILHDINLLPIELLWYNPKPGLFSVRLENPLEKGHFGTNGKGRTCYYALASAYAEFIERLQNGFVTGADGLSRIFLKKIQDKVGFFYYPDEKIISKSAFRSLPKKYLTDIFGLRNTNKIEDYVNAYFERIKENGLNGVISVPFFDVKHQEVVYLPYNLTLILSGSNGMAAGNSPEEAIFQALCELIERYAVRTVYFEELTPPNIPDDFLATFEDEFHIINVLRKSGYDVFVKDSSCGMGLPAVGVLLIDKSNNKYRLNVGAETSFKIALSRALTEIFQGIKDDDIMQKVMLDIPTKRQKYFLDESDSSIRERDEQIRRYIIDGTGVFPYSLFSDKESYHFINDTFKPKETYKDEVVALIDLFSSFGYPVYIRNVSFLGFPSYHVYVPEVSVWGRKSAQGKPTIATLVKGIDHDKLEDYFFPTVTLLQDKDRLNKILNILTPDRKMSYSGLTMAKILKLEFYDNCEWSYMPVSFFITLLCFVNKEYGNAKRYLKAFMDEGSLQDNEYYNTVYNLFSALETNMSETELKRVFSKDLLNSFSTIENVFAHINLPNCPNCQNCPLSSKCLTKENFLNATRIAVQMKKIKVKQNSIMK